MPQSDGREEGRTPSPRLTMADAAPAGLARVTRAQDGPARLDGSNDDLDVEGRYYRREEPLAGAKGGT